ncbi:MAG: 16S rRNA (guanine(527)-N(7))-methyltransferase RsmG [Alphaproteobacteria bacterium]|nr:16S rRNA (guanine(527)-N(7))-methyltransferase RsmG [Alphaproteobacteria bacterium]
MQPENFPFPVSDTVFAKLELYHALLLKWQKALNLVSPKTLDDAWNRHFIDSAQLVPLLEGESRTLVDIGSGAGFPGLVIAMMRPDLEVYLVESDERKCEFLRTVSRETEGRITIRNTRIEMLGDEIVPDVVTARALADIKTLLDYSAGWAAKNPALRCLFLKGRKGSEELSQARAFYEFSAAEVPSKTDPEGVVLDIRDIQPV